MRSLFLNIIPSFLKICDKKGQNVVSVSRLSDNRLACPCVCCIKAVFPFYVLVFGVISNLAGKMLWKEFWNKLPLQNSLSKLKGIGYLNAVVTAPEALIYIEYCIEFFLNVWNFDLNWFSLLWFRCKTLISLPWQRISVNTAWSTCNGWYDWCYTFFCAS